MFAAAVAAIVGLTTAYRGSVANGVSKRGITTSSRVVGIGPVGVNGWLKLPLKPGVVFFFVDVVVVVVVIVDGFADVVLLLLLVLLLLETCPSACDKFLVFFLKRPF